MSEWRESHLSDFAHLRVGTALAWISNVNFGLEVTVLRIIRIALFVLLPTFALAGVVTGCDDDTGPTVQDMSGAAKDMVHTQQPHDMAQTD